LHRVRLIVDLQVKTRWQVLMAGGMYSIAEKKSNSGRLKTENYVLTKIMDSRNMGNLPRSIT